MAGGPKKERNFRLYNIFFYSDFRIGFLDVEIGRKDKKQKLKKKYFNEFITLEPP